MKRFFVVLVVVLMVCTVISCDVSSVALSELIRKSQPRDDIRWSESYVIPSTKDSSKVDVVLLTSQRGLHSFFKKGGENIGSLKNPILKNSDDTGLYRRVYIPTNYDSTNFHKVILQTVSSRPKETGKFYSFDVLTEETTEDVALNEITLNSAAIQDYDDSYGFKESSSLDSTRVMYRTGAKGSYTYHIARFKLNESTFDLEDECTFKPDMANFEKDFDINRIWESPNLKNAVVMYNEETDRDYDYVCKYAVVDLENNTVVPLTALNKDGSSDRNLLFDHFVVYNDKYNSKPIWMGFLRSGVIYHSASTEDDFKTSDSSFSFDKYAPLCSFVMSRDDADNSDGKYGCMLFARYTGTGFIVSRFLKMPNSDNKVVPTYALNDTEYRNSYTISNAFAENLRAEEVSAFGYFNGASTLNYKHSVLVLTVEVGVSTYRFSDAVPYRFTTGNGEEKRDEVDFPFYEF